MNEAEVKALIRSRIKGCTITEVEDFDHAFAIYFVNDEYYKSKKLEDMKIGTGPIIYIKNTGEIFETGSGQTAQYYIQAYRECGDVYGRLSNSLEISDIPENYDEKKAIIDFKIVLGIGLSEAKVLIEKLLKDKKIEITLENEWETEEVKNKFLNFGY